MKQTIAALTNISNDEIRLDRYLFSSFPDYSRSYFKKLIEQEYININGKSITKSSYIVKQNDVFNITFAVTNQVDVTPLKAEFTVLEEHEDFLVIDKPAGLVVHNSVSNPDDQSLVRGLLHRYPEFTQFPDLIRPGIVHRLDKNTSGLILVARNVKAQIALAKLFKNRSISKTYLALAKGTTEPEFSCEESIGRNPFQRHKMGINGQASKPAKTLFKTIMYYPNATLVQAQLITGRTHQIRVHLASLNHSIIGDATYGSSSPHISRQALHAWKIGFSYKNNDYSFESPLPLDIEKAAKALYRE